MHTRAREGQERGRAQVMLYMCGTLNAVLRGVPVISVVLHCGARTSGGGAVVRGGILSTVRRLCACVPLGLHAY